MSASVALMRKPGFGFTAETLPEHPLFAGLAVQFRQILAECAMRADFEAGDRGVEAGQPAFIWSFMARLIWKLQNCRCRRECKRSARETSVRRFSTCISIGRSVE